MSKSRSKSTKKSSKKVTKKVVRKSTKKTTSAKKSSPKAFANIVAAPKAKASKKVTAKKSTKKSSRNYFTVSEDWTILTFLKRNSELKGTAVAKNLGKKLSRTSESIRDRVKKYLNKISSSDQKKIQAAAKVFNILTLRKPQAMLSLTEPRRMGRS